MSAALHQASCVSCDGRAILIEGAPGSGKSLLALALIDRGAILIGDDGVLLEARGGRLLASPPPRITGLLEVRNLGLIAFPVVACIPVALVLSLDPLAERYVEAPEQVTRGGVDLPLIRLWPGGAEMAIKAELALKRYGLAQ